MLRSEETAIYDPYELMGDPKELAEEFIQNLDGGAKTMVIPTQYEYKSEAMLFGLPVIHICFHPFKTAKGILAIGTKSLGIISIGGISAGLISLGGISFGLVGLGGISLAWFFAMGGIAVGYEIAIGGLAVAMHLAVGGLAIAKDIVICGQGIAQIVGYSEATNLSHESIEVAFKLPEQVTNMQRHIDTLSPQLNSVEKTIVNLILKYK